jgi:hypothetical protein
MRIPTIVLVALVLVATAGGPTLTAEADLILKRIHASAPQCFLIESVERIDRTELAVVIKGLTPRYDLVKKFRSRLSADGSFSEVRIGRTYEVPAGVTTQVWAILPDDVEREPEDQTLYTATKGSLEKMLRSPECQGLQKRITATTPSQAPSAQGDHMEQSHPDPIADPLGFLRWRVNAMFERGDTDGDGMIGRNEFRGETDDFEKMDVNGDGLLTQEEVLDYMIPVLSAEGKIPL